MAEISTTQAFSDGDTVTATKLNNITANAALQTEAITNRSNETTVDQANDLLLMYDASATALKKITLSNAIKAGTASNFPVTGNATVGGTLSVTGASTLTGNTSIGGALGVTGNVAVNTDKFNITAASGNTAIAGTLGVTGLVTASGGVSGNLTGNVTGNVTGNTSGSSGSCTGNSATATALQTGRTISVSGDATGTSASFDGTGNASIPLTLANSGVSAGTHTKVTVDSKGRVTAGTSLSAGDIPTLNQNTTGNASTATTLQTARTINGISFNGSANIETNPSSGAYSNGYGARTVQSGGSPSGGSDGDIVYIY